MHDLCLTECGLFVPLYPSLCGELTGAKGRHLYWTWDGIYLGPDEDDEPEKEWSNESRH